MMATPLEPYVDLPVNIEQQDIDNGVYGNAAYCPLALAFNRQYPGYRAVVSAYHANVQHLDTYADAVYYPDSAATDFVLNYDRRRPVKPVQVVLRAPVYGYSQPAADD